MNPKAWLVASFESGLSAAGLLACKAIFANPMSVRPDGAGSRISAECRT
jgi:hypothetical protein